MALGDITFLNRNNGTGTGGSVKYAVLAAATAINSGEPVIKVLGDPSVTVMLTNSPVVGTTSIAGITASASTNVASPAADGTVQVWPVGPNDILLVAPNAPTSWDTQAEYDALVGNRVLLDLTTGVYTILASDSSANGCVVMPLDISKYPNKVAFVFRAGASYLA